MTILFRFSFNDVAEFHEETPDVAKVLDAVWTSSDRPVLATVD